MTDKVPAWVDIGRLCEEISVSAHTVTTWIAQGILPPARMRGGKRLWKWSEVDDWLTNGGGQAPDTEAERVRDGTQAEARQGH